MIIKQLPSQPICRDCRGGGYIYVYDVISRHPNYDEGNGYYPNDIALIHVPGAGVETDHFYTKPIEAFDTGSDRTGQSCWTTGWGSSCAGCALSSQLQKAETPVISEVTSLDPT